MAPETLSPPGRPPSTGAVRRVLVAGLPGPGAAWLAEAAGWLVRAALGSGGAVWIGPRARLTPAAWAGGSVIVALAEPEPGLIAEADHVLYAYRDLRDAVVACQRGLGLAADPHLAGRLAEQARAWERIATWSVSLESLLQSPGDSLAVLARHLALPLADPDQALRRLQGALAAAVRSAGRQHTPARAFFTALPRERVAAIEERCGDWLRDHGYSCVACPSRWAGVVDRSARREEIWREAVDRAAELAAAPEPSGGAAAGRAQAWLEQFGAPEFQAAAYELLAALGGDVLRTRAWFEALRPARDLRAETAWGWRRLLAPGPAGGVPEAAVPAAGKTSPRPLPVLGGREAEGSRTVAQLAEIVRGRTIGFMLHGSSVAGFADRVEAAVASDVPWVTVNHFALLEERCLGPLGCDFSTVFCCADGEMDRRAGALEGFLRRDGARLLIARPDQLAPHRARFGEVRARIAEELLPPVWPYPNSLTIFLRLLVQAGPRRIVLFGCDGYLGGDDESLPSYLGAEEFRRERRPSGVLLDTLLCNAHLPRLLARWRERLGSDFPEIVNCSPGTLMRAFPVIDYGQVAAALAGAPLVTAVADPPPEAPVPEAMRADDAGPDLVRCLNAGRRGDLVAARTHALRAMRRQPDLLTPFAQRILQTDPWMIAAAFHLLTLAGAERPGAEQVRRADFARERREMTAAVGVAAQSWEEWE